MSFNVSGATQVPLELWGGLVTEMPPANLPAGVSPLCQDVVFRPGAVRAREALTQLFPTTSPFTGANFTYAKSYVDNKGTIRNIYLDANGNISIENINASPGTKTIIGTTTPGTYAKSITAFGREYIAISDGLRGQEVPLQYDGTFLDRVTQDGPGDPPSIQSVIIPASQLAAVGSIITLTVVSTTAERRDAGLYLNLVVTVVAGAEGITPGQQVTIAGNSGPLSNGIFTVITVDSSTQFTASATFHGDPSGAGGTAVYGGLASMVRNGNVVTANTGTLHGLQPGYQAQITNVVAASLGSGIAKIVIDNENLPGLATVTTNSVHGLVPEIFVSIQGVLAAFIGGVVASLVNNGNGTIQVTTTTPHGLSLGDIVKIAGSATPQFNFAAGVSNITDPFNFTLITSDLTTATDTSGAATLQLAWPVPDTSTPNYFQVVSAPTPKTFQIALAYGDGTWTTGTVSYAWDGTFFVLSVPTPQSFTYTQYGPNDFTAGSGTVTPFGQAAPGIHQMQVMFLTRQLAITKPSPPIKFVANGGQYLSVSNIPIGPPNVIARILAFTGADGQFFFYIPTPAEVNGQLVSTSTQINDNSTTAVLLDFSDPTLFSALSINTPGNDLSNQIVLDSALGFAFFSQRLVTYGQRNRIQNFLNLGFDGGALPNSPTLPTGWFLTGSPLGAAGGILATGHYGQGWSFTGAGSISQSAYLDWEGAPILTGNTPYYARAWLQGTGTAVLTIHSPTTGFSATATLTATLAGGWAEAPFVSGSPLLPVNTPLTIPPDMLLSLSGSTGVLIDEISIIYSAEPYIETTFFGSYVDNPEGFDGVSGVFGAADDTRKIMTCGIIRGTLCHLTREPAGRLHSTVANNATEPAGWTTNEVASSCGAMSAFCMAVSQADDATASGGEEWLAWMSYTGLRIYGGDQPWKISQEIQPDWDSINTGAWLTTWCLNDPSARRIYCGLPIGLLPTSPISFATAPTKIYHVDYKNLDTAFEIAQSPPIHVTFTGKLAARDHARKWAPWNVPANGASMIYRDPGGPLYTVFMVGNGQFPGVSNSGCGNIFALCNDKATDDCLGQIFPVYVTAAFTGADTEQALQLGGQRHLLYYLQWYALGILGARVQPNLRVTVYPGTLSNPWPINISLPLRGDPTSDDEWGAGNATGQRFFIKFEGIPAAAVGPS